MKAFKGSIESRITVTLDEAASLLGLSKYLVRKLIFDGQLSAKKVGSKYLIKPADLEKVLQ